MRAIEVFNFSHLLFVLPRNPLYVFDRLLVSSFKGTKESLIIISLLFRLEMQGTCTFEY